MLKQERCHNCGSTLEFHDDSYCSVVKCPYCRTEYHIDNLGRIEEYKVKLKIQNRIVSFYVGSMEVAPIEIETTRLYDTNRCYIRNSMPEITLTLHSYDWEDLK